jgi:hypothetical protein
MSMSDQESVQLGGCRWLSLGPDGCKCALCRDERAEREPKLRARVAELEAEVRLLLRRLASQAALAAIVIEDLAQGAPKLTRHAHVLAAIFSDAGPDAIAAAIELDRVLAADPTPRKEPHA